MIGQWLLRSGMRLRDVANRRAKRAIPFADAAGDAQNRLDFGGFDVRRMRFATQLLRRAAENPATQHNDERRA